MKIASITGPGLEKNNIFSLDSRNNRDNANLPFYNLKQNLKNLGIDLHTRDLVLNQNVDINIDMNIGSYCLKPISNRNILLLLEIPEIIPANYLANFFSNRYQKILSWRKDSLLGEARSKFVKIPFPNFINTKPDQTPFTEKNFLVGILCGNKSLYSYSRHDLYVKRWTFIKQMQEYMPNELIFYGPGWEYPYVGRGFWGKISPKIRSLLGNPIKSNYPSYFGYAPSKNVYTLCKFALCYENSSKYQDYVTEKIFDAFSYGVVPIYWGAKNIENLIPSGCYIDRRNFSSDIELINFLNSVSPSRYETYRHNAFNYLNSSLSQNMGEVRFRSQIISSIIKTLRFTNL